MVYHLLKAKHGTMVVTWHALVKMQLQDITDVVPGMYVGFEISYSRYASKHYITGVYIAINDIYR
jgi:hypothetical protein